MAGTDKGRASVTGGPRVVLVDPQLGENIGMVARAMLNCGLTKLCLVRPRDGWPNPAAEAAAAGASEVLDGAEVFDATPQALAGCRRVYATTARPRDMVKPVLTPQAAAHDMRAAEGEGAAVALAVRPGALRPHQRRPGAGRPGHRGPAQPGLRVAQSGPGGPDRRLRMVSGGPRKPKRKSRRAGGGGLPAERGELLNFLERLERALDGGDFFHPPEKRASMVRNLRNIFLRGDLTDTEVRTLHGVVSALLKGPARRGGIEGRR